MDKIRIAIVGATGLVGQTMIKILQENKEEIFDINLFASNKSKDIQIRYNDKVLDVKPLNENSFDDVKYALFFTSEEISKIFIPIALKKNVVVIDNSSAFRMNEDVKLIAYGVNDNLISKNDNIVSNPNCCCIQAVKVLNCLRKYKIKNVYYNTYQSVSGSGRQGIDDLIRCRKGLMPLFYETDISFTCIPKIGGYKENGFTEEEDKLIKETKKILNEDIEVIATCVRVPVMFSHGVSIQVELESDFEINDIIAEFNKQKDIVVCDKIIPTSVLSCKNDKVYVGRIRKVNNKLLLYCVADNIRVGAATNSYKLLKRFVKIKEDY